nr:hypothetical protein [Tanacetum cinerariifolium]
MIAARQIKDQGMEATHLGKKASHQGITAAGQKNECSERSNSGNDTDIRPSYDTKAMAEVPNIVDYNMFAVEKQHTKQSEFINNTYVDQNASKHENERVLLASSIEKIKADIEANKEIREDLKKVNMSISQEIWFCKCELEKYKVFQSNHKEKEKVDLECQKALGLLIETK